MSWTFALLTAAANHPPGSWDPFADKWEEGFRRLLDYVKQNGDARVPVSYVVDGYKLGTWVVTQRQYYTRESSLLIA